MRSLLVHVLVGGLVVLPACSSHSSGAQSDVSDPSVDATISGADASGEAEATLSEPISDSSAVDATDSGASDAASKGVPWNTVNKQPPGWYATPAAAAIA